MLDVPRWFEQRSGVIKLLRYVFDAVLQNINVRLFLEKLESTLNQITVNSDDVGFTIDPRCLYISMVFQDQDDEKLHTLVNRSALYAVLSPFDEKICWPMLESQMR